MTEDQWAAYKTAKSTRPAWANALIVAVLLVIGGFVTLVVGISPLTGMMFGGAGITALVAGVLALASVRKT